MDFLKLRKSVTIKHTMTTICIDGIPIAKVQSA